MYVTRRLSHCLRSPESLSLPPEGPNSGFLVLQDDESETTTCFGLCKNRDLLNLPFPQNKNLVIQLPSGPTDIGDDSLRIALIPVLNKPLSSNRYYAMKPRGLHMGKAYACSRKVDMITCCFRKHIQDVKPRPFDPNDIYQQFHIRPLEQACLARGFFAATSIAPDGFPPYFLRRKGWRIYTRTPQNYKLGEALGVNKALRARLPGFNFPPHCRTSGAVVVGKWYCPFMFIRDGELKDQMKRSMFYEMTLEQRWEQIFACENDSGQGNAVTVDATVQTEMAFIKGREASWDESNEANGVVWFRGFGGGGETSIGLSSLIIYRMRWEQQKAGWARSGKGLVRVNRTEEFAGSGGWKKYGCYVLVERFLLKRMDGSLALACDFKHSHVARSKWE